MPNKIMTPEENIQNLNNNIMLRPPIFKDFSTVLLTLLFLTLPFIIDKYTTYENYQSFPMNFLWDYRWALAGGLITALMIKQLLIKYSSAYFINDHEFRERVGIFTLDADSVTPNRVSNLKLTQNFYQKLTGSGVIQVFTENIETPELQFQVWNAVATRDAMKLIISNFANKTTG
jgi:uncharacterized membrane protein YdbT with pleckstrin-like domain